MLESAKTLHQNTLDGIGQLQAQMTFRFSVLSKLLDRQMAQIAKTIGLSLGAYRVLATTNAFGEISAADLVRYTGYDKAAISRHVTELERDRLLEVRVDPTHGRRKLLTLTDAGQAALDKVAPVVTARRDALSAQLTTQEERLFLSAIEKLAAFVADDLDHGAPRAA